MGVRSLSYAAFYLWIAVVSIVCLSVGFDILYKGGQDCEYTCPLLTLNATFMNEALSEAGYTAQSYATGESFGFCTSAKGFCLMRDSDGDNIFENECVERSVILGMTISEAFSSRCMFCDESGVVYWPSTKVASTTQWIPANECGDAYSNAGLTGGDVGTPSKTTISFSDGDSSATIDITSMGESFMSAVSQDLKRYPYCEGTSSIGWDVSSVDQKAGETVIMLLLLCIYYTIMAFCCLVVGLTFYHFTKYEKDDWTKLKYCERIFACLAKQMQFVVRIANTISIIFVVFLFVNIWVYGVCTHAANSFGEKRFYPAVQGYSMFVLVTFILHCIGGCLFRSNVGMETAFFTPRQVYRGKDRERMGCCDYVKKYWICFCKYYNRFGGL